MKRTIALLLAALMAFSLAACGSNEPVESSPATDSTNEIPEPDTQSIPGTWEVASVEIDGSLFTVDEIKAIDDSFDDISFTLILKDGGKGYMNGSVFDWEQTEDGLIINNINCSMQDGYICMTNNNVVLYLEKVSDSQLITALDETEPSTEAATTTPTEVVDETTLPSEDTALVDGMRPEFKEAMDAYEAFYDEYYDFMKKYMENPYDISLLAGYADIMSKAADMEESFEAWDDEDLNNEELKYYLEVNNRVMQKLVDITG